MSSKITPFFPIYQDVDGDPLDAGYIYIGVENLNPEVVGNQLNVFWDAALTVPAAQPIRTVNGYPSRSGSPAAMYVAEIAYSVTVRNKNTTLVTSTLSDTNILSQSITTVLTKTAMKSITPDSTRYLWADGSGWIGVTGAAPATYADNVTGTAFGTIVIPTGGDGSSAWLREYGGTIDATWFGLAVAETAANNTTALTAACAFAHSLGGGIVSIPPYTYSISEFSFASYQNVIVRGLTNGYTYGQSKAGFSCTTGVFAIRFPDTSSECGLEYIGVQSNGVMALVTPPYSITTNGVEYGVLIETGTTVMRSVSVYGFQYGTVIASGGNSNIFDSCGFVWNTKVGFAVTRGSAACYALYHPNLVAPASPISTTVFTMKNCNMRRNAWGMILRDGAGTYNNLVVESNIYGGMLEWVGTSDSGVGGTFEELYTENNWFGWDPTVTWATAAVSGNNLLLDSAGTPIPLVDNASNALSDFGYQIIMGGATAGTTQGPGYQQFRHPVASMQGTQKHLFIKQGFQNFFHQGSSANGDQPNAVRLGYATGGFLANVTHFYDWNGTLPATLSNAGAQIDSERSASSGGLTAIVGRFRGLAGNVEFPATQVPSADVNTLDDYEEGTFTPAITLGAGSVTYTTQSGVYTKIGNRVFFEIFISIATVTTPSGALAITGLPFTSGAVYVAASVYANNLAATATTAVQGYVSASSNQIAVEKFAAGASTALGGDVQATSQFMVSGHYDVA